MTRQCIIPPPHVWGKIEEILDKQDAARKHTEKLISDTFLKSRNARRLNFFFTVFFSAGLVALVILKYSGHIKES
ncbi:hypothetical protein [Segetibacter koreensis]|uniref:hypothetical protein n=1 Tax=Segetibacter koreensis TaxID=398037 RepID=UPI000380BFC5|nr:hypothetical protein [Segetibacter koreensis]